MQNKPGKWKTCAKENCNIEGSLPFNGEKYCQKHFEELAGKVSKKLTSIFNKVLNGQ